MATTYTPSLSLAQMGNGENSGTWGTVTNNNWSIIEAAVAGAVSITMSGGNYTLNHPIGDPTGQAYAAVIIVGGTGGYQVVAQSGVSKTYIVYNTTSSNITFGAATGSVVTINAGQSVLVFSDGINYYTGVSSVGVSSVGLSSGTITNLTVSGSPITSTGVLTLGLSSALTSGSLSSNILYATASGNLAPVTIAGTLTWSQTTGTLTGTSSGGGSGTVTSVSVNTANGFTGSVANPTTTPNITIAPYGIANGALIKSTGTGIASASAYDIVNAIGTTPVSSASTAGVANALNTANNYAVSGLTVDPSATTPVYMGSSLASGGGIKCQAYNLATSSSIYWVAGQGTLMAVSQTDSTPTPYTYLFSYSGTATAQNWNSTSDQSLKENIEAIPTPLESINAVNPVQFSYKTDGLSAPNHYGVIAQELETILPNLVGEVTYDKGSNAGQAIKTVSYSELIPILIGAIQELQAKLKAAGVAGF